VAIRTVGAREANQQFSALLAAAERNGDTVIITRRGHPIARLVPETHVAAEDSVADRIDSLIERYARPMGGKPFSREDLYDREDLRR